MASIWSRSRQGRAMRPSSAVHEESLLLPAVKQECGPKAMSKTQNWPALLAWKDRLEDPDCALFYWFLVLVLPPAISVTVSRSLHFSELQLVSLWTWELGFLCRDWELS